MHTGGVAGVAEERRGTGGYCSGDSEGPHGYRVIVVIGKEGQGVLVADKAGLVVSTWWAGRGGLEGGRSERGWYRGSRGEGHGSGRQLLPFEVFHLEASYFLVSCLGLRIATRRACLLLFFPFA